MGYDAARRVLESGLVWGFDLRSPLRDGRAVRQRRILRAARALVCVLAVGACAGSGERGVVDDLDPGAGAPGFEASCVFDEDCAPAAATCCACPTFATRTDDPAIRACDGVTCEGEDACPDSVRAACDAGRCVLACAPMACPAACPSGFARDAAGCLTCACASTEASACAEDRDCASTRADCCGCARGGADTAVPVDELLAFDVGLACPPAPVCPGVSTCDPEEAPRCVQGRCELVSGELPPDACGRPDLPACPAGALCMVNASALTSAYGVGQCVTP